jgi:glucose/arabinose dehydrogenase
VPRIILLVFCIAAGCSKSSAPSPPAVTPGLTETINGTERIGWDQLAADAGELAAIGYALYVDGTRTPLADATCAPTNTPKMFACSARLPGLTAGSHTLQLASFTSDGTILESQRSAALMVNVVRATTADDQSPNAAGATAFRPGPLTLADGTTLRAEAVVDRLADPVDLAFTPDGRLVIAERAGRIHMVRDTRLLAGPAISLADTLGAATSLQAIAVDPDFARTQSVFAVYAAPSRGGPVTFTLARYREAYNTLADRVVLLDGVRASAAPAAALRFGADRKLYVAFDDGGDARQSATPASLNGKILRLNADGTTPAGQDRLSPVRGDGHRSPRGFEWDLTSGNPSAAVPASAALYRGSRIPRFAGTLLMATAEGRLVAKSPSGRLDTLAPDRLAGVRVVAVSPDGAIYFATSNAVARLVPDTQ